MTPANRDDNAKTLTVYPHRDERKVTLDSQEALDLLDCLQAHGTWLRQSRVESLVREIVGLKESLDERETELRKLKES